MAKEPYLYGKRALWRETEVCARVKRVLFAWQKRPVINAKETYRHRNSVCTKRLRYAHVSEKAQ